MKKKIVKPAAVEIAPAPKSKKAVLAPVMNAAPAVAAFDFRQPQTEKSLAAHCAPYVDALEKNDPRRAIVGKTVFLPRFAIVRDKIAEIDCTVRVPHYITVPTGAYPDGVAFYLTGCIAAHWRRDPVAGTYVGLPSTITLGELKELQTKLAEHEAAAKPKAKKKIVSKKAPAAPKSSPRVRA